MLPPAQQMWIDIIKGVVINPIFNEKIGDMNYVLGNMIAKYVSSAEHYRITEEGLKYIRGIGLDERQPIHTAKHLYGKDKNTILEHIIPVSIIKKEIIKNRKDGSKVTDILVNSGFVIIATRDENRILSDAKLAQRMPSNWTGFGDRPEKRYEYVGIKISDTLITHAGPICR